MKRLRLSVLTIVLFLVFTVGPWLIWPLVQGRLEGENTENRNMAEMPSLSLDNLAPFPKEFENYLSDHLPFRRQLILANNASRYYLFHDSTSDAVVVGKQGWLYYTYDESRQFYNGEKIYNREQLKWMADSVTRLQQVLSAQDTELVLWIVPNKDRVYSEYLPDDYGPPAENCALNQVLDMLGQIEGITVVCPYDRFMDVKKEYPDHLLYHMTDTHWNDLGAHLAALELMQALGIPTDNQRFVINDAEDYAGDLANMLGLADIIEVGRTSSLAYCTSDSEGNTTYSELPVLPKDNRSVLICQDSFYFSVSPVIHSVFENTRAIHWLSFDPDTLKQEKPDIFIFETVERYLDRLLDLGWFVDLSEE